MALTKNELEVLSEIVNIGSGRAALSLSEMTGSRIELAVPHIRAYDSTSFQEMAKSLNLEIATSVQQGFEGGISGQALLAFPDSNAFKFTKQGSVTLRFHRPAPEVQFQNTDFHPSSTIAMSVLDTGIGIPADKQEGIFKAFQQADGSTSREYGGTGLGLTISREMAQLLGGELQVSSREGEGSTFTLYLPLEHHAGAVTSSIPVHQVDETLDSVYEE